MRGEAPSGYWMEVRAPGLPLLLTPLSAVGGSDVLLRSGALLVAAAGVALTWWEGRLLFGRSAALVAAGLVALSPGWNLSGWQVLPDIPGATLTLACVVLLTSATQGDKVRWWALLVPPLAALATMVRFGAPLLLGPALLMVVVLRWRVVLRSWLFTAGVGLATAVAVSVVWLVPAVTDKSTPPLLIFLGRQTDKAVGLLDRLSAFVEEIPILLGLVVGIAILVGLIGHALEPEKAKSQSPRYLDALLLASLRWSRSLWASQTTRSDISRRRCPSSLWERHPVLSGWVRDCRDRLVIGAGGLTLLMGLAVAIPTVRENGLRSESVAGTRRRAAAELATVAAKPCVLLSHNPSNGWYSGRETALFPVERRWVDGDPCASGIGDRDRMLMKLDRR